MDFVGAFAAELQRPDALPELLAFYIVGMADPQIHIAQHMELLDQMAALLGKRLARTDAGYERAVTLMDVFSAELGFSGSHQDYYSTANSLLNTVLERRSGLPIMLSLVCVALGRRINLQIDGLGFPSHFMARYRDEEGEWLLDPFNGHVIALAGAADYLALVVGQPVVLPAEVFQPVAPSAWAQRILNNLRNAYLAVEDYPMGARVVDYMLAITPSNPSLWSERALLHFQSDNQEAAIRDLRHYFFLRGQFSLLVGPPEARGQSLAMISSHDRQLYELYSKLLESITRLN